jgi:hypothetical protein
MKGSEFWRLDWFLAFVLTLSGAARAPAQNAPPIITAQPQTQTVPAASTVTFSVATTVPEPLFYQWRKDGTNLANGGNLAGVTTATLILSNAQSGDIGAYSVTVSNAYGAVLSSNAMLTLWPLVAWGQTTSGKITVPAALTNVTAVAAGQSHSVVLHRDGRVRVWGATSQTNVPSTLTNAVAIAAGGNHTLTLREDGTVVAWGSGFSGQTNVPPDLSNVVAIAGGETHSLALKADGTVAAWGNNASGQTNVPADLVEVVGIAAGGGHSLALKADGKVAAWGSGSGTNVPAGLSDVVAVSAGRDHGLSLRADGTVVA